MRHGRPHHRRLSVIRLAKLGNELVHQIGNIQRVRGLIHDRPRLLVVHVDGSGPPAARTAAQVVVRNHEVQALQQRGVVAKGRIVRQLQDEGHGVPVTLNGAPDPGRRVQRVAAAHGRDGVVQGDVKALDAVGALDGPGGRDTPQQPAPAPFAGDLVPQREAKTVQLGTDGKLLFVKRRCFEQHVELILSSRRSVL